MTYSCCDDQAVDLAELAYLDLLIQDLRTTLRAIAAGGKQSYRLSTGQTDLSVMSLNVATVQHSLQSAMNDRRMVANRLNGCGTLIVVPGF